MSEKKSKKILWIEDDYCVLKGLTRRLEKKGYEIIPAKSYDEAKSILDTLKEDLCIILVDLIIPRSLTGATIPQISETEFNRKEESINELVENGMELLDYIKQELNLPVIVVSIVTNKAIIDRLDSNGVKRLQKFGLLPDKLEEAVSEELDD